MGPCKNRPNKLATKYQETGEINQNKPRQLKNKDANKSYIVHKIN